MKKLLLSFVLLLMAITSQAQTYHLDTNNDGSIELTDALIIINYILGRFNPEDNQRPQSYLTCPDNHHPHLIDLGLPSGTKWACCNVGATTPEGYGGYYAWGETEEKSVYSEVTYQYCTGEDTDGDGWYNLKTQWQNLGDDISGTSYDVAHVKWGGYWVMPSKDQLEELISNCTYKWTTENGVNGGKLTSNINGASIFLPESGIRSFSNLFYLDWDGHYWSSTYDPSGKSIAYYLYFDSESAPTKTRSNVRFYGQSVRPVVIETPLTHLQLSHNRVDMLSGGVATVIITSGNGKYFVGSSNLNVAKATVKNGQVTITAGGAGTATITVTDITSSETATIIVRVTDNLVINGNCESDDVTCLWGRDGDADNYDNGVNTHFVEDGGFNGSRGIRVQSIDNAQYDWETQFFVYTPNHVWKTGEHYRFKMMYRADKPATISTQSHGKPGRYLHYETFGNLQAELDWQEFEFEGEVSSEQDGMQTITFLLNVSKEANNYYFDDISWVLMDTEIPLAPLQLSQNSITTIEGEDTSVIITSGNGNYRVSSSDENVVTVMIDGSSVIIAAVGDGTATITVTDTQTGQTANISVTVAASSVSLCPDDHHPHMIDLGLPSGTLWACCNVDTEHPENQKPENDGGYYAWGDTEEKSVYDWDNYGYDFIGNDPIIRTMFDVAHVKWGGAWQMPTYDHFEELLNKCTHQWTTLNGIEGFKFSGSNGVGIFLSAAGGISGYNYFDFRQGCIYWSGTLSNEWGEGVEPDVTDAKCLYLRNGDPPLPILSRSEGLSVRPVITRDAPLE